jgi:hypothetical protein
LRIDFNDDNVNCPKSADNNTADNSTAGNSTGHFSPEFPSPTAFGYFQVLI